jgi:MFS transporter, SP family, general alpha glucoside:H+ symporter
VIAHLQIVNWLLINTQFATTSPAYASEVLPVQLRVYMTSWTNMYFAHLSLAFDRGLTGLSRCFIIGQFISAGVLRGFVHREDAWGYRIPYALQWVWPFFLIPLIWFAPESPWHLARKNRLEEAEQSIRRLQSGEGAQDPKKTLATIIYTNNLEEQLSVGTSYHDCFKGFELRRTEIACFCFGGQLVCGLVFA